MADNIAVRPSTAATKVNVATDLVGGVHYPIYKTAYGADGAVTQASPASPLPVTEAALQASIGNVTGISVVHKFGEALDCDQDVATDIWDGADGTTSTDIWVPPTVARIHAIKSTAAADDGEGTPSTGMRTVRVYGLQTWGSAETSEDVTLNGTANVNTVNSYVIIHRMKGLTFGSGGVNAGIITATAASDSTVTAAIQAGNNQTLMAIYGVPSTQTFYMTHVEMTVLRSTTSVYVDGTLFVREDADTSDRLYWTKHEWSLTETAPYQRPFVPPRPFAGPCIIKLQVSASVLNTKIAGGFDGYLVTN